MLTHRFFTVCNIHLGLGERAGKGTLDLNSRGFLEFALQPRKQSSVVDLQLVDAEAHVNPFTVSIDGRHIEVDGFVLVGSDYDTRFSYGEIDQTNGNGWFRLYFSIMPTHVPVLRSLFNTSSIRFELFERGKFDLNLGRIIETNADPVKLPEEFPAGIVARVGRGSETASRNKKHHCDVDQVKLGAAITSELTPSDLERLQAPPGDLMVCPNTSIALLWYLHDVAKVKACHIEDNKKKNPDVSPTLDPSGRGQQLVVPVDDAEYVLVVDDPNCAPKSSPVVRVWVVKPGEEIQIQAQLDSLSGNYVFSGNPKLIGKNVYMTSIKSVACLYGTAFIPEWDLASSDRDGRVHAYNRVSNTYLPLAGGDLALSGCNMVFSLPPQSQYYSAVVTPPQAICFSIRCACY
jgi:hypothetical protein